VVNALASISDKEIKRELKKEEKKLQARYGKQKLPPEGQAKLDALAKHLDEANKFVSEVYAAEAKRLLDAIDAKDREETKAKKAVEQRTEVPLPLAPIHKKKTLTKADHVPRIPPKL
jgi:Rad3-related DNA helicase